MTSQSKSYKSSGNVKEDCKDEEYPNRPSRIYPSLTSESISNRSSGASDIQQYDGEFGVKRSSVITDEIYINTGASPKRTQPKVGVTRLDDNVSATHSELQNPPQELHFEEILSSEVNDGNTLLTVMLFSEFDFSL